MVADKEWFGYSQAGFRMEPSNNKGERLVIKKLVHPLLRREIPEKPDLRPACRRSAVNWNFLHRAPDRRRYLWTQ